MNKKIIKLFVICITVLALTGCTVQLKDSKNKLVKNDITGQTLTKNILCKPTDKATIKKYTENGVKVSKLDDCNNFSVVGSKYNGIWESIFIRPLAWLILKIEGLFNKYGWSIVFTTILIRLVVMPFTKKAALQSENMKKAQPELNKLEKKYANKNDQDSMMKKSQEMMFIYKKYGINPMVGCLFSLIQIPLFFAFYESLNRLPAIFEENFYGIKLGMTPGMAISQGKIYYVIIIILVVVASYYGMKLNSGASMSKEQESQMKTMMNMMIMFMGIAAITLPTGIAIYWIVNNVFTIAQNLWVRRKKDAK